MSGSVWHWGRHAWLYAELLHALQGEYLLDLGSQQREPSFLCHHSTPLLENQGVKDPCHWVKVVTGSSHSPQYPNCGNIRSKRPMSLGQSGDWLIP